ncbi:hypothetical protein [Nakamurella sp. PAMC28650]|uniref:hypothetical protein n=1 Tax=Nakamurella sp. PAMC28650 TaxID=2762325 RepID=UPI00164D70AE|nr:hypothetical protein [Nakamurella sp. PAMC28650]QNK82755.1 hypothetical protein H7F38_08770 [Nakamurella sp. PAMC28650]
MGPCCSTYSAEPVTGPWCVWRRALDFVVNGLGERPGLAAAQCPALTDAELVASMKARRRL